MADAPQYRMDTGSPDQLPKGAAQDLNQAAAQAAPQDAPAAPEAGAAPAPMPQYQTAKPDVSQVMPGNEDDSMLFGPTSRPDEHISTGYVPTNGKPQPPANMSKWYPSLVEAAKSPDAPQMFKEMLQQLQYHLGQ